MCKKLFALLLNKSYYRSFLKLKLLLTIVNIYLVQLADLYSFPRKDVKS